MKIEVLIQGDPDVKPITRMFHYDESILIEHAQLIKKHLSNNRPLNINETLGLFVVYIINCINEGKSVSEIQKHMSELVSSHQVMIGVPESLRQLTFKIINHAETKLLLITEPIPIRQYFLIN